MDGNITVKPNKDELISFLAHADGKNFNEVDMDRLTPGAFRFLCDELEDAEGGAMCAFAQRFSEAKGYARAATKLGGDPDEDFHAHLAEFKKDLAEGYGAKVFGNQMEGGIVFEYQDELEAAVARIAAG